MLDSITNNSPSHCRVPAIMPSRDQPCPFCGRCFIRLRSHLPHCDERNGRDYSAFLARSVVPRSARGTCSLCGRHFHRLDTHLRVSASCRKIAPSNQLITGAPVTPHPASPVMNSVHQTTTVLPVTLSACKQLPTIQHTTTPVGGCTTSHHHFKPPIKLPKTSEAWEEADILLSSVTPLVLQAITAEEKNNCLGTAVYNILAARFGTRPPSRPQKLLQSRIRQHDRALKEVTCLKNEARRALRRAKSECANRDTIQSLAANFLSLLRQHSHLKRVSSQKLRHKEAKAVRERCHRNFWGFAKELLDQGATSQITPDFSSRTAHAYFSEVYKSAPYQFQSPSWMPSPPPPQPDCTMEMTPITDEELAQVIKRSRSSSAPSPFDRVSYTILKRCPSLRPALLDLFNRVIMEGSIPSAWKAAAIKLIPKSSAKEDPSSPNNFRPIALTSAISKLLSSILKDRWLGHMRVNNYLNPDLQKAFLPTIPGVVEHQAKLAAVIKSARRSKRSLAIAWLDIANAYGSVHHSLIQFSLAHYHAPPEFCKLMRSWYTDLSATISTDEWSTDPVPLRKGVYQGDPLSVVIFLTVFNTLSDTLCTRKELGFSLPQSPVSISHLLYADDACVISSTLAGCQHLLNMVQRWLEWAQMKAKVPKCHSMILQASTGKRLHQTLTINGDIIPSAETISFKFLGMPVRVYTTNADARSSLQESLQRMLTAIDETLLTRQQKLRLFKHGVCPRLSWPLLVEDFPISWLERELQPLATKALKKWAGLARSSNKSILFLPVKRGGLALPSLTGLYKKLQAMKMAQLLKSRDQGVRKAADLRLSEEKKSQRMKFKPAALIDSISCENPSLSRKAVTGVAKAVLMRTEADERHQNLSQLPSQGEMTRSWGDNSTELWVKASQSLPPEVLKFVLNASLNTLPTNANLHMWGKKTTDGCPLCQGPRQTLPHILNNCPMAMQLRRYSKRHDAVLQVIGNFIRAHLPSQFSISIDTPSEDYSFPHHITPTNLRPDIVWWNDQQRVLWLLELTISYEPQVADARERKKAKYHHLVEAGRAAGYQSKLITVEVGSRGMLGNGDLDELKEAIKAPRKEFTDLSLRTIRTAIMGSFSIWGSRNHTT